MERRPRYFLRSSVQNECCDGLLADRHNRVKPLTPEASTLSWGPARVTCFIEFMKKTQGAMGYQPFFFYLVEP